MIRAKALGRSILKGSQGHACRQLSLAFVLLRRSLGQMVYGSTIALFTVNFPHLH